MAADPDCKTKALLIATARYLAAHAPTVRSQKQTFDIAPRLHRSENVFEDDHAGEISPG